MKAQIIGDRVILKDPSLQISLSQDELLHALLLRAFPLWFTK